MTEYFVEKFYDEYAIKQEDTIIAVLDSSTNAKKVCDLLNEQEERIQKLEQEKESWKSSTCHDINLKSMLSFEIGKLTKTKNIDAFLDFYYKHFCKISGDV